MRFLSIVSSTEVHGAMSMNQRGDYLRRVKLRSPTGRTLEIQVVHGSIANESTEAIVNPANPSIFNAPSLNEVSFSILKKGGAQLKSATHEQLVKTGSSTLSVGNVAVVPSSGALKSKYIIHAVGPIWSTKRVPTNSEMDFAQIKGEQLATTIVNVLKLADSHSVTSVSIPAISTFLNGGSRSRVARVIFDTILNRYYMNGNGHSGQQVQLVRLINSDELTSSCMCNEFDKREFANDPQCTHIHTLFNIPINTLPLPDEAEFYRNSPYLAE